MSNCHFTAQEKKLLAVMLISGIIPLQFFHCILVTKSKFYFYFYILFLRNYKVSFLFFFYIPHFFRKSFWLLRGFKFLISYKFLLIFLYLPYIPRNSPALYLLLTLISVLYHLYFNVMLWNVKEEKWCLSDILSGNFSFCPFIFLFTFSLLSFS